METRSRCSWCVGDQLYENYHDQEWGGKRTFNILGQLAGHTSGALHARRIVSALIVSVAGATFWQAGLQRMHLICAGCIICFRA